jgi:hypothetical protein
MARRGYFGGGPMRGLADPRTTTGLVQRALTDAWQTQAELTRSGNLHSIRTVTLTQLLERLLREGRAESRWSSDPNYMSGGFTEWRRPQKEEA